MLKIYKSVNRDGAVAIFFGTARAREELAAGNKVFWRVNDPYKNSKWKPVETTIAGTMHNFKEKEISKIKEKYLQGTPLFILGKLYKCSPKVLKMVINS
jgi:hypothetical protein